MDYKYIETLLESYFAAETTLEEESILRTFFSQEHIPAELQQWRALFAVETKEELGDDFDERMLALIEGETPTVVKAQQVKFTQRLRPLFRAAAVIAIFLTIGGALQAPWDSSWTSSEDYAALQHQADTVAVAQPVQAENAKLHSDLRSENMRDVAADSTMVLIPTTKD